MGRPGYVPKAALPIESALKQIHEAGGLAFVGHPGLGKTTRKLLPRLLELPFDGIEAYHISHSPGRTGELLEIAKQRQLLVAGGSDCHGTVKRAAEMGKVRVPYAHFARIESTLAKSATPKPPHR